LSVSFEPSGSQNCGVLYRELAPRTKEKDRYMGIRLRPKRGGRLKKDSIKEEEVKIGTLKQLFLKKTW